MKLQDQSRPHRVGSGEQAEALDHPVRARLLMACVMGERSLADLARVLGQPLPKLHYHVTRLVGCGLLRVDRVQPRHGRPIRYYRAIAESFLVSLADVAESIGDRLARELRQSLADQANRRELSLLYRLDEAGQMRVQLVDPEGRGRKSRAYEHWKILRLTAEQRVAMAEEITALIARYEAAPASTAAEPFLVHAAFAPKL
jgi:DNA-binding transcriptional ArsR family regulator